MANSLTKTELEIMQYIWNIDTDVTPKDIREHFSDRNWSKQSVNIFLRKLVKSNFLKVRKESITKYYYRAAISEQEYSILPAIEVLENVFNNSYSSFFCALLPNDVSDKDIRLLEEVLTTYEKRRDELSTK